MEYNKDESTRCLELANAHLSKGDKEKALKFAVKSEKLYPSEKAKGWFLFKLESAALRRLKLSVFHRMKQHTAAHNSQFFK